MEATGSQVLALRKYPEMHSEQMFRFWKILQFAILETRSNTHLLSCDLGFIFIRKGGVGGMVCTLWRYWQHSTRD